MTELNTANRRKPARILAAVLAVAMAATAIPATAFAGPRGHGGEWSRDGHHQYNRHHRGDRDFRRGHRNDRRHGHNHRRRDRDDDVGAAIAGGIIGFAIGSIIADGYNQSRYAPPSRTYYGPTDDEYVPPQRRYVPAEADYAQSQAPVYAPAPNYKPEPFTDDWYAYCTSKYRTFDPQTGTFQPNVGPRKLCQ